MRRLVSVLRRLATARKEARQRRKVVLRLYLNLYKVSGMKQTEAERCALGRNKRDP